MDIQRIKELALANGFSLKPQASGNMDLNAYVYDFANAVEREVKAQSDQKIKLLLCDEHLKKCESPTGVFNSQYPDEEPCLICLAKQAKAQAVPEWKDYTVESPRIDGPYQIFIMNQQLVAKWESPWGFSSIEDGDALNQELITHWSVLGNDPAIEPQEPAND